MEQIAQWNKTLSEEIEIRLIVTEDKRTQAFREFCETLSRLAPKVKLRREKEEGLPGIRVGKSLIFQMIPAGMELAPFLEVLEMFASQDYKIPESVRQKLDILDMPALLRMYISEHCPFCPQAVRQIAPLALAYPNIRLSIADGGLFPELPEKDGVQSSPTLLLEDMFRWSGTMPLNDIADAIVSRDPANLGAASLENMLSEGQAFQLSEMMVNRKQIFPAFADVLTHEKWQIRLGAMAAAEDLISKNKPLSEEMIPLLWHKFESADNQVRGDILYLFGEIGGDNVREKLNMILQGDYSPEIMEAAQEAADML